MNQPLVAGPMRKKDAVASSAPTTIEVVARMRPLSQAKKKQTVMMRPAFRLSSDSGKIAVPASLVTRT